MRFCFATLFTVPDYAGLIVVLSDGILQYNR